MFRDKTIVGNRLATKGNNYDDHPGNGIDIIGSPGVDFKKDVYPVFSSVSGKVMKSHHYCGNTYLGMSDKCDKNDGVNHYGNHVKIESDCKRYIITLAHLEFEPLVKEGDKVTPYTMLGIVGNTGDSRGGKANP
jgi:murein DD-endopeptidase MepM/ murein hydrolase activator NlpD